MNLIIILHKLYTSETRMISVIDAYVCPSPLQTGKIKNIRTTVEIIKGAKGAIDNQDYDRLSWSNFTQEFIGTDRHAI